MFPKFLKPSMNAVSTGVILPISLVFVCLLTGCSEPEEQPVQEKNTRVKIESVDKKPTTPGRGDWSLFRKRDEHYHKEYTSPAINTFWGGNYASLEAMAKKYREEKTLRNDGGWALDKFYFVFDSYHEVNQVNPEQYQEKMERMLKEWQVAFPDSPTPQVALAGFYVGYAWYARGASYADKVEKENWKLFEERLLKAEAVLNASEKGKSDPYYYQVAIRTGLGLGWPLEKVESYAMEGLKLAPESWGAL